MNCIIYKTFSKLRTRTTARTRP